MKTSASTSFSKNLLTAVLMAAIIGLVTMFAISTMSARPSFFNLRDRVPEMRIWGRVSPNTVPPPPPYIYQNIPRHMGRVPRRNPDSI